MSLQVDIRKSWKDFSLNVCFDLDKGPLGILGASGCGKSMTLKCIAGILRPDDGKIILNGRTLFDSEKKIDLKPQKRRVGYLFQDFALFPNMTVAENVGAGLILPKKEKQEQVCRMIEKFHLTGLEKKYPSQLSGGQKQRTALARIMAYRPDVLLLDEPFSALDAYLKEQLLLELLELLQDYSGDVILVTHSRDEAYKICPELMVVKEGLQVERGSTKALFQNPAYLETARMTGCKNLLRAKKRGPHELELTGLGLRLVTERPVPEDVQYAGIRAHYFYVPEEPEKEVNLFRPLDFQETEAPFEINVIFHTKENSPGIWWKLEKETWNRLGRNMPPYLALSPVDVLPLR